MTQDEKKERQRAQKRKYNASPKGKAKAAERSLEACRASGRKYREKNKAKLAEKAKLRYRTNTRASRNAELRRLYGITVSQYEAIFAKQGGICAICKLPPKKKSLGVDHDHRTGKVRGLLCSPCNVGIGCLGEDKLRFIAAISYLGLR